MSLKKKKKQFCPYIISNPLPCRLWTKCDGIISSGTREGAGGIIVSIAIRLGTSRLENLRVLRRLTSRRCTVRPDATVLRHPKSLTRALTTPATVRSQLRRAPAVQVRDTPGGLASTRPATPFHYHRQVVPINQAHVVEVL